VTATITVDAAHDLASIIGAAGGNVTKALFKAGELTCPDIEQAALDAALAAYDVTGPVKTAAIASATAYLATLIANGFTFRGKLFQIDDTSRLNISTWGALALGAITSPSSGAWSADFYWVATDNSHVSMDAATMYAFSRAVGEYVSGCRTNLRAIKDAILAAKSADAVKVISVMAGYPQASA
jgi:hypothetical protein